MTYLSRYCTGCGEDQLFEQFHAGADGGCPDVVDGDCQEWACTGCGDAFVIGFPLLQQVSSSSTSQAA